MPTVGGALTSGEFALSALGTSFLVRCADERLNGMLRTLFDALVVAPAPPVGDRVVLELMDRSGENLPTLFRDGEVIRTAQTIEGLVVAFGNELNRAAVGQSPHVTVHAGGVARGNDALVLPAAMESGKTTLTAALVAAGWDYLSDEAVAIDRTDGAISPYPKPLFLDPGSWPLFPQLEPMAALETGDYKSEQWHVAPEAIRENSIGGRCRPRWIVFPRYEARATTHLSELSRAAALIELAENTFAFNAVPRQNLDVLAAMVRQCACYRLRVNALDEAVHLLSDLAEPRDRQD